MYELFPQTLYNPIYVFGYFEHRKNRTVVKHYIETEKFRNAG